MDESEYNALVARTFRRLMTALDHVDPDLVDTESTGDMITITASTGEKCIINTQRATRQVWVAGKGQGVHFSHASGKSLWLDDKDKGLELFAFVSDVVQSLSGVTLSFP